jgi:hypothetical protein
MTRQEIFDAWARPWQVWSLWVKPVVFASLPESVVVDDVTPSSAVDLSWMPPIADRTAIVLDLPGAEAAIAGLSLAEKGYIPVPLYNAHPGPGNILKLEERETPLSVVEVGAIAAALVAGAARLNQLRFDAAAPPAFLLDANRRIGSGKLLAGLFDNRSVSFPTDFPSGNYLLSKEIRQVLLVQRTSSPPQQDLSHTLRLWQKAGLKVMAVSVLAPATIYPCNLKAPSRVGLWWHYLTAALGFRSHPLGGFGGLIPEPSAG